MDISNKLKLKRKELNLTQQQVADKVFVTRQTISKWELGKSQSDLEDKGTNHSKGVFEMNQKLTLKDVLFTLLFGVLFLPVRFLYTLNQQHKGSKVLKYLVKPALLLLFLLYVGTLNLKALVVVIAVTLFFYYLMTIYYSED